jgi:thioredoxin 1
MKRILILSLMVLLVTTTSLLSVPGDDNQDKGAAAQQEKKPDIKVTFVELGSVRCIPCKKMQPIMKEIEEEYGDQVKVVFYDVRTPEGRPYAYKYRIRVIPTQVFLDREGNEYFRHQGFFPKEELVKVLKQQGVKEVK